MTWSIELTPWALPPLLAVLLVLRDLEYIWVHRRESSARALGALAGTSGLWAFFHLLTVVTPTLPFSSELVRAEDVLAAMAPLAWLWFALSYTGREQELKRWPMWLLYAFGIATLVLTFHPTAHGLLFGGSSLVGHGGVTGLRLQRGSLYWSTDLVRVGAVTAATVALVSSLTGSHGSLKRGLVAIAAGLVATVPVVAHLRWSPESVWKDLAPTGFGIASAMLGWGLLRYRLVNLGPVARWLVMVEIQDPIVVLDGKGRIVDVNRAARRILGLHPYGDVPIALGTLWARSRKEPLKSSRITLEAASENGREERAFDVTVTSLDERGAPGRSTLVLRDVTERERMEQELIHTRDQLLEANEELERLANTDALTGLANRRHFLDALDKELDRSARYERPVSLVLMDLDHFKDVNDSYGHAAGDKVLKGAARVLLDVCRDVDLAARLGGEELVLLLPETEAEGARAVAERVRRKIETARFRSPVGDQFRVTASLGVASVGSGSVTPGALLQRADEAMYSAKEEGRNRVRVAAQATP